MRFVDFKCLAMLAFCVATVSSSPLPQGTSMWGQGGAKTGSVGFNHNFDNARHSQLGGGVQWRPGQTSATVNGQTDIWNSQDGRSRAYVGGDYSRVLSGPARGADNLNGRVGGETDVWKSDNGNTRLFAGAERRQVLKGPGAGTGETSIQLGLESKF